MKAWFFVAVAMVLATSAVVSTARADERVPVPPQTYAPPPGAPAYAPPAAYMPPPQQAPAIVAWTNSTVPAKIGSPKLP